MTSPTTVSAELYPWVVATRGALEWLLETGDVDLEVPAGFVLPALGEVRSTAPRWGTPDAAPGEGAARLRASVEAEAPRAARPALEGELQSVLERRPSVPGLPPQPFDLKGEAAETTFIDTPSLLQGPEEAALVFGWPGVKVAFVAGPLHDDATPEQVSGVGDLVIKMAQGMKLELGQVFFGYLAGPGGVRPNAHAARAAVRRQLAVARPEVIVTLGDFATRALCGSSESFSRSRGRWFEFEGIPVMPTFHPEAMLQHDGQQIKLVVWDDLKKVKRRLNIR